MTPKSSEPTNGRRGRPKQVFNREPETPTERRRQQRALGAVVAVADKLASIRHMLALAEAERGRVILRAAAAGVSAAEIARILGVTDARVSQWRKEARLAGDDQEGDEG